MDKRDIFLALGFSSADSFRLSGGDIGRLFYVNFGRGRPHFENF